MLLEKFKVLVITLSHNESEFKECCDIVKKQNFVKVTHYIIKNKTEINAHKMLFKYWNKNKNKYDFMIKIDADTVLINKNIIYKICQKFSENSEVTGMQIGLKDYFTDSLIAGLNCFRSCIKFSEPKDKLYCDRVTEIGHKKVLKPNDLMELYPAGLHCKNPSNFQSFHFGYRRFQKKQKKILNAVIKSYENDKNPKKKMAILGAIAASKKSLIDTSYKNIEFKSLFEEYKKKINNSENMIRDFKRINKNNIFKSLFNPFKRLKLWV